MEFLDRVKKIAAEVASTTSKKSKEIYSISKLKLEISDKQNKVKALYKEVGYEAYKAYKQDGKIMEAISELLTKIDDYEEQAAELRKKIDDVKNFEEVDVEDIPVADYEAVDADVYDGQSEYDEAETEPID